MEMRVGKVFVGGISWETSVERLREYFQTFGEVVEAVIMKDRNTGRARGFGFIVFANAFVAEKVVQGRHVIDGRLVEAKNAVPRFDYQNNNKNKVVTNERWPSLISSKKIFVGGLASTVKESDFRKYFEQFGLITDVVVMYDHITQRSRGFGFITFDSEKAVDKVLIKKFHELNGKMVEVKRAVPKELSPGSTRSQLSSYSFDLSRVQSFLNPDGEGYSSLLEDNYGVRMDDPFSTITPCLSGCSPYRPSNHGVDLSSNSQCSSKYEDFGSVPGGVTKSCYSGNSNKYCSTWANDGVLGGNDLFLNLSNGNPNYVPSNSYFSPRNRRGGVIDGFGSTQKIWSSSPFSVCGDPLITRNTLNMHAENNFGGRPAYNRNNIGVGPSNSMENISRGVFENLHEVDSFFEKCTWQLSSDLFCPSPFGFELGNVAADIRPVSSGNNRAITRPTGGFAA